MGGETFDAVGADGRDVGRLAVEVRQAEVPEGQLVLVGDAHAVDPQHAAGNGDLREVHPRQPAGQIALAVQHSVPHADVLEILMGHERQVVSALQHAVGHRRSAVGAFFFPREG